MSAIPEKTASDGSARSRTTVRFEDLAQDGRMLVDALATGVNETLWRDALGKHPVVEHAFPRGILAILTRFVVEAGEGPFDADGAFESDASFSLAHGLGPDGTVQRLYMNAWVETYAPIGRTNLAPPPNAGERALVGRSFSEHVFTRPFGPPSERRVTRLDVPGVPDVPGVRYDAAPFSSMLAVPKGATPLDSGLTLDASVLEFGLRHTDSNQHVNSLVYPRYFEDACLRRLASTGRSTATLLARTLDVAYRKPCFAGQTVRVVLTTYELGGTIGAVGGFYDAGELDGLGLAAASPHCAVRLTF